jgi:hypothetical protein
MHAIVAPRSILIRMQTRASLALAAVLAFAFTASAVGPSTKANDDSCDIALLPAATLLLPYFEVDFDNRAETTLFSVTNVTNVSQIARVTLWTDFSYPVASFNIYLTGYDVQSINLFDIIANGAIGTGAPRGSSQSPRGTYSDPNPDLPLTGCVDLPGNLPPAVVQNMRLALTEGRALPAPGRPGCNTVGHVHEYAVGYATIDVVGNCSSALPTDAAYFANDIRYDNVLIGDYQQVSTTLGYAQVNPMVHIRAVPEGGTPQSRLNDRGTYGNRFERTFYSRFQNAATLTADARQPLPSRFAFRWINGGPGGFQTQLHVWREGVTAGNAPCGTVKENGRIEVADSVMFDEDENGEGVTNPFCPILCVGPLGYFLPTTARVNIADVDVFPQTILYDKTAGWVYLNLDDRNQDDGPLQGWVIVSMRAEGRYAGDMDATALGNGCSPVVGRAEASEEGSVIIAPSPNGRD